MTSVSSITNTVLRFVLVWGSDAAELNRLAHGYPFVWAATTVFMRDIAANLTILVPVLLQMMVSGALFSLESVPTQVGLMR